MWMMSGSRELSEAAAPESVEEWQAVTASVRGAAHIRSGAPNQDAARIWQGNGQNLPLVLAMADGHGGASYTRSHIGAAYAVNTAVRVLARDLLPRLLTPGVAPDLTLVKRTCDEWLPKVLVRLWQERVGRYTQRYPFAPEEITSPPSDGRNKADESLTPYGATLVAALLTEHFHLYLQLGDGDILTVAADGVVSRPALPEDARLLGNETTSLCMADGWHNMRLAFQPKMAFQPVIGEMPALILLSTDGYSNSFVDSASFEQIGSDFLSAIRTDGLPAVGEQLPNWLAQTSVAGSGDDITVALAFCSRV
jgi:hypothetical protein